MQHDAQSHTRVVCNNIKFAYARTRVPYATCSLERRRREKRAQPLSSQRETSRGGPYGVRPGRVRVRKKKKTRYTHDARKRVREGSCRTPENPPAAYFPARSTDVFPGETPAVGRSHASCTRRSRLVAEFSAGSAGYGHARAVYDCVRTG